MFVVHEFRVPLQNKLICMHIFGDSCQAFQYFLASGRLWSSSNRKTNIHVSLNSTFSVFHTKFTIHSINTYSNHNREKTTT